MNKMKEVLVLSNPNYYYRLCCEHKGKVVRVYETSGREHVGKIMRVDEQYVWLERVGPGVSGYGYGYYGYDPYAGYGAGYGAGGGFWFPVALAALGGFALGAAFFWW